MLHKHIQTKHIQTMHYIALYIDGSVWILESPAVTGFCEAIWFIRKGKGIRNLVYSFTAK